MAENSTIEWCDATFNPWEGCTRVSPGCANCYAETRAERFGSVRWGPQGTRRVASESYWRQPVRWNAEAARDGVRRRVFCASLADVFEDWAGSMVDAHGNELVRTGPGSHTDPSSGAPWKSVVRFDAYDARDRLAMDHVRKRLFTLIAQTPCLDWLLLTKRPENVTPTLERLRSLDLLASAYFPWRNVWLGASVENQEYADRRIPELLKVPAAVRFLSVEPLLGPVDLSGYMGPPEPPALVNGIHWVIVGGESGPRARPFELDWARSIQAQCDAAGVPWFFKQAGSNARDWTRGDPPNHEPPELVPLRLRDRKGGDLEELPASLRAREFPGEG